MSVPHSSSLRLGIKPLRIERKKKNLVDFLTFMHDINLCQTFLVPPTLLQGHDADS